MKGAASQREQQRDGATRPAVLRQIQTTTATTGDQVAIENVLYTSSSRLMQRCEVRRVAPGAIVIRHATASGDKAFYLAAAGDDGIDLGRFATDAAAVLLSSSEVWQIGGKGIRLDNDSTTVAGRVALTARAAKGARSLLRELWAAGEQVDTPLNAHQPQEQRAVLTPAWTSRAFKGKGCLIDGVQWVPIRNAYGSDLYATDWILPVLLAEPRLSPQRGSGMVFTSRPSTQPNTIGDVDDDTFFEPILKPTENAEFTLRLPEPARVTEFSLFGEPRGKPPSTLPSARLKVRLAFSTDGFHTDRRSKVINLALEPTYHNLYKGHSYIFECYRTADLDEMASEIHVQVQEATYRELLLTDVQVRGKQTGYTRPIQLLLSDLDGDERDEIIAWTNEGQVSVLNSDNTMVWQNVWPAGVLAVDTWDLDGDSHQEILLSTTDCRVHVLNQDGTLRWEEDFSEMYGRTDELFFRDGCAIFGMAAWPVDSDNGTDVLLTSYFGGMMLDKNGHVQSCFKRTGRFTRIRPVPAALSSKPRLAIWNDIPWAGPGQLEWWTPEKQGADGTARAPNGTPVFFDVDDYDRDGRPEAFLATEQGIGLYAQSAPEPQWEHMTEAPVAGVSTLSQDGHAHTVVFVYGRRDGFICAVDSQGNTLHSTFLDEPIRCLTAVETSFSPSLLLIGTDQSLCCLNAKDFTERWRQPGSFQHIDIMDVAGQNWVIAVTASGELQAFDTRALITR
jgi:hypothetical protein